ncbi:hypothetical protein HPB50_023931 [Hyalomma asiaticum]|uniref:Uncharacterized protein n=1 Tax=Hyalomma asiaticum TaxID=266040 RepID=A0ACB7S8U0_HYAAI|nr:hypothetical protein HPB50_023931 [Hyalomma asiaticum]
MIARLHDFIRVAELSASDTSQSDSEDGSPLSPMLWNVTIHDLLDLPLPTGVTLQAYADDTVVIVPAQNRQTLAELGSRVLRQVIGWAAAARVVDAAGLPPPVAASFHSEGRHAGNPGGIMPPVDVWQEHPAARMYYGYRRLTRDGARRLARAPGLHVYTDGSYSDRAAGAAFVVLGPGDRVAATGRYRVERATTLGHQERLRWARDWTENSSDTYLFRWVPRVSEVPAWFPPNRALVTLLTGHGRFVGYFHRFNLSRDPHCACGQVCDGVDHYIFECPMTRHLTGRLQTREDFENRRYETLLERRRPQPALALTSAPTYRRTEMTVAPCLVQPCLCLTIMVTRIPLGDQGQRVTSAGRAGTAKVDIVNGPSGLYSGVDNNLTAPARVCSVCSGVVLPDIGTSTSPGISVLGNRGSHRWL